MIRSKISDNLIAIGDSHLDMFTFFCNATCRVVGASAYGLTSKSSATHARQAFLSFVSAFPYHTPLICVGEVDCNSIAWNKSNGKEPEDIIKISIDNLFKFLKDTGKRFIIPSVVLPPVESYKDLSVRNHVDATKEQRTSLVKIFNTLLESYSESLGHYYLDITTQTTGPDGFVDSRFIVSPKDVHLSPIQIYDIVRVKLDGAEHFVKSTKN